jgi:oxalate decarboxylase
VITLGRGLILGARHAWACSPLPARRTFDFRAGDVGFVPFAIGHYVENTGATPVRFLEIFKSDYFADVSLDQCMALTPPELVEAHLN